MKKESRKPEQKKSLEIQKEREYIVVRTVSRLTSSSNESAGRSAKNVAVLHENYAARATPNGCRRTKERQGVFTAARKFICTKVNPYMVY